MDDMANNLLRHSEELMKEFYSPATSNARKREIELAMKQTLGSPQNWKFWIDVIPQTQSHYLMLHCLNLLNDFISNFWSLASSEQKSYIKTNLWLYLTQGNNVLPHFITTKLVKCIVDIARSDWPHFYADYFSDIENLIKDTKLCSVGIKVLRLTSEEFTSTKEDIRLSRREELKQLLKARLPVIFELINIVLSTLTSSFPQTASNHTTVQNAEEALQVLCHVLSWMPNNMLPPEQILRTVFTLAALDPNQAALCKIATESLNFLGDVIGRSVSAPEMLQLLWTVYEFAFVQLEKLTQSFQGMSEFSDSATEYIQQFVEVLRPLLVNHLQRFEGNANFPTMVFLEKFFHFTFAMPISDIFTSCIDIWNDFLDRVLAVSSGRISSTRDAVLSSYSAPILAVVDNVMMKIQMKFNKSQLEQLADAEEESEVSEREEFFTRCICVLVKAGELFPGEVLKRFSARYAEIQQIFVGIERLVQRNNAGGKDFISLNVSGKKEFMELHCCLRDAAIIARATSSLCGALTGDLFSEHSNQVFGIFQILLSTIQFINGPMNLLTNLQALDQIRDDFVYLHASLYSSLESSLAWLSQFHTAHMNQDPVQMQKLIWRVGELCVEPVLRGGHITVCRSSARALQIFSRTFKIASMLEAEFAIRIISLLTNDPIPPTQRIPLAVLSNLCCAITNLITLPLTGLNEEEVQGRTSKESATMLAVCSSYLGMSIECINPSVIKGTFSVLQKVMENASEDPKRSKQMLLAAMNPVLYKTVQLLPALKRRPQEQSLVLNFVLCIFSSLRAAFPPDLPPPLSDLFEGLFEQFLDIDEIVAAFKSSDTSNTDAVVTCFDLLKLVVSDPTYKGYLPSVLGLCQVMSVAVVEYPEMRVDFKTAVFELLITLLNNHWTYFFKSVRMVQSNNGDAIDVTVNDEKVEEKEFVRIMRAFGAAVIQPEVSVAQLDLKGLSQLHTTKQLFTKAPFINHLRKDFLDILFNLLIQKEKQILLDDIYLVMFQIAAVDEEYFEEHYMRMFLESLPNLRNEQKSMLMDEFEMESDQVAFTEHVRSFVSEVRCLQACNSLQL